MSVSIAMACPICTGDVDIPCDVMLGELLDCDECGSELEVRQLEPSPSLAEAPMSAEDWGE